MAKIKLGFLGFGNMAMGIAKGMTKKGSAANFDVYACAAHYDKLCVNAKGLNIHPLHDARELVNTCDYIIIAIKPYMIDDVIIPIKDLFKGKTVISLVAGYNYDRYAVLFGEDVHHISTIPNTPIEVCEGICISEDRHNLTDEEYEVFKAIFEPISSIVTLNTKLFSTGGTMSGCTPAFVAMFIEALGDAGVKYGLSRQDAYAMAAKVLVGTGKLYLETNKHPGILKDAVCSPKGTTIKGVASLEESSFRSAIIKAIDAIEFNK